MEQSSVLSLDRNVEKGEPSLKKSVKEFLDGLVNLAVTPNMIKP